MRLNWLWVLGLILWFGGAPAWCQDSWPVTLVARDGAWSARLPGEPDLRSRGRSRTWSYLDAPARRLFLVVETGGWPPAGDAEGWRKTAGAVLSGLSEGKTVEVQPETFQGHPSCRLQVASDKGQAIRARAVQIDGQRHLLLICVPLGSTEVVPDEFFATLAVPAQIDGRIAGNSEWSLIFPGMPEGSAGNFTLQDGGEGYGAREFTSDQPLSDFQSALSELGPTTGQANYSVEGREMHQSTIRRPDGSVSYHRLLLLAPNRALWLTASGVAASRAQSFFSSLRIWK